MKDKIISLDFDDVLYDLMSINKSYIKDAYSIDIVDDHITSFTSLYETYPSILNGLWNDPTLYVCGDLLDGAQEFYKKLVSLFGENRIQIVTNSFPDIIDNKNHMIKNRFGFNCDVIHCNKSNPKHINTKDTILIDDSYDNVIKHNEHNDAYSILFNYNRLKYATELYDNITEPKISYTETYAETLAVIYSILGENINEKK